MNSKQLHTDNFIQKDGECKIGNKWMVDNYTQISLYIMVHASNRKQVN